MSSTRLPGKVMLKILDRPVIHHIYDRLGTCEQLDSVVISTGEYNKNKEICDYAEKHKFPIYIGSDNDLIDRLYKTALKFNASAIVRITADCPLVDPIIVDELVSKFLVNSKQYDIITNCQIQTYPHGLDIEIYSTEVLKKLCKDISEYELREWIPMYVQKYPEKYKVLNITNQPNLSHLRLTLDYEEDFKLIEIIYKNMKSNIFFLDDILKLFAKNHELININAKYVGHHNIDAPI